LLDNNFAFFVGVDWGSTSHQICVLDAAGQPAAEFSATHGGDGLRGLCQRLLALAPAASAIAVAIESPSSPATEPLLQAGLAVFSLNPKQLDRFRDRYFPAGSKDDRRDAFVLATSLRTDPPCFRRLQPEDPRLGELRALSRMHQTFKLDLVAYCNRLRDLLVAAWPELLSLCPAANEAWLWRLLEFAPSAPQGARLSLARLRSLLTRHRIRRFSPEELQKLLRQPALPLPASSFQRSAVQVQALLPVLLSLDAQQRQTMAMLENLLGQLAGEDAPEGPSCPHRDVNVLLSLPGVGTVVGAAMLAEAHEALSRRDYHALRAHAGVAPVTRQSGKSCSASMRRACNHALRNAVYHWSRVSTIYDPRSKAHYAELRQRGHSHGRALRGVADRLLKMLCSMLRSQTVFEPNRRHPPAVACQAAQAALSA